MAFGPDFNGPQTSSKKTLGFFWKNLRLFLKNALLFPKKALLFFQNAVGLFSSRRGVELEGIEPSSKQGSPELSTRLSQPEFSCAGKTWATNRRLIL